MYKIGELSKIVNVKAGTIRFYEKCGFTRSHSIPNFFTDNYDHPIYEGGVQLVDMIYLQRPL